MKKLSILVAFIFCTIVSLAQGIPITNNTYFSNEGTVYHLRGLVTGDVAVQIPTIDTLNHPATNFAGAIVRRPQDGFAYMSNGVFWELIGTGGGGGTITDTIYVKLPLYVFVDSLGRRIIQILHDDGIETPGIVTWTGVGLIYNVTSATYWIGGKRYVSAATTVTLSAADPTFPTQYIFIVDTLATATFLRGTPAALPLAPQTTVGVNLPLTNGITLIANATTPPVTLELIYDENTGQPTEWAYADNGGMTSDRNNTDNPYRNLKADFVSLYNSSRFYWVDDVVDTFRTGDVLNFHLYLNGALTNNMYVTLFNGGTRVTNYLLISPSQGLNQNDSNQYQNISVPFSSLTFNNVGYYNTIAFEMVGADTSGAKGFYIDYINIQSTQNIPPQTDYSNKVDSVTIISGSDYWWAKGVPYLIGVRGGGSGGGASLQSATDSSIAVANVPKMNLRGTDLNIDSASHFQIDVYDAGYPALFTFHDQDEMRGFKWLKSVEGTEEDENGDSTYVRALQQIAFNGGTYQSFITSSSKQDSSYLNSIIIGPKFTLFSQEGAENGDSVHTSVIIRIADTLLTPPTYIWGANPTVNGDELVKIPYPTVGGGGTDSTLQQAFDKSVLAGDDPTINTGSNQFKFSQSNGTVSTAIDYYPGETDFNYETISNGNGLGIVFSTINNPAMTVQAITNSVVKTEFIVDSTWATIDGKYIGTSVNGNLADATGNITIAGGGGINIYNTDSSLSSDRTVNLNDKSLIISQSDNSLGLAFTPLDSNMIYMANNHIINGNIINASDSIASPYNIATWDGDTLKRAALPAGGVGGYNANIGSGYRLAVPNTNNIKTLFGNGVTLDSATNANAITFNASFAGLNDVLFTSLANNQVAQYDLASGKWKNQNTLPFSLSGLRNNDYFIYDSLNGYWKNYTANITPTWSKPGDSVVTGNVLGSTNNRSLDIITNNIRRARFDSLGALEIFSGASVATNLTFYRTSSTTTKAVWWGVTGVGTPYMTTNNGRFVFNTNYNGGSGQLENFALETASTSATIAGSPQATITGKLNSKVPIPATGAEASYSLEVQNNSGTHRGGIGIDSAQNLVIGIGNIGLRIIQDNSSSVAAVSGVGTLFRVFPTTGNIMIKNKGTYVEDTIARFAVVSDTGLLAQGSRPAPVMDSTARKGITSAINAVTITNAGSGYTNGSYGTTPLTGGSGVGATANITVSTNIVTAVSFTGGNNMGRGYVVGDVLTATIAGGSGFQATVASVIPVRSGLQVYDSSYKKQYTFDSTRWTESSKILSGSLTLDFGSTAAQTSSELTINVVGAADGDIVSVGAVNASHNANSDFTAYVSAANVVTVKFNNYSAGAIDPASGTFKVKVFKD